jgi:hypothetical protein
LRTRAIQEPVFSVANTDFEGGDNDNGYGDYIFLVKHGQPSHMLECCSIKNKIYTDIALLKPDIPINFLFIAPCTSQKLLKIYIYNGDFKPEPGQKRLMMVMVPMVENAFSLTTFLF